MEYTGNLNVDSRASYFEKRNEYILQSNMQIDLLFFGDSITEGFNPSAYGAVAKRILNSGIGGERINTAKQRLVRDALDFNPKTVHFMLGVNDLLHYPQIPIDKLNDKVEELIAQYISLVKTMSSNGIEIICASILKLAEIPYDQRKHVFINYMYHNEIINRLNDKIEKYCDENHMRYIDYNEVLTNEYKHLNVSYTSDGIHLNEKGYFEMFKLMRSEGIL